MKIRVITKPKNLPKSELRIASTIPRENQDLDLDYISWWMWNLENNKIRIGEKYEKLQD